MTFFSEAGFIFVTQASIEVKFFDQIRVLVYRTPLLINVKYIEKNVQIGRLVNHLKMPQFLNPLKVT